MQTIGERLEEARKKKGVSIREAAEATKIRGDYLQKFESNQFDIGLTEIYTRGFLRSYANFLKLPAERIVSDYAGLGRADLRPRQPGREVYGRMDISVASSAEGAERGTSENGGATENPSARPLPHYPRGGSSLPAGPDPAVIFKYVKWGGIAIIAVVAAFVVKALVSGGPGSTAARTNSPVSALAASAAEHSITLVALDTVAVRVSQKNPDGSEGSEIFNRTLRRGQTQAVPWRAPIFINATAGEHLEIEWRGRRFPSGFVGSGRAQMENPPSGKG